MTPDTDGVDHINIYSKGKTKLGRLLTNFANTPFQFLPYGRFESVEGFWYYYLTGCKHEHLKTLHGWEAKQHGKLLRDDRKDKEGLSEEDRKVLKEAIRCKLRQNLHIVKLLTASDLPLTHYYAYGNSGNWKIYLQPQYDWITEEFEIVRTLCKEHYGDRNEETSITKV